MHNIGYLKLAMSLMMFSRLIASDEEGVKIEEIDDTSRERRSLPGHKSGINDQEGFMEVSTSLSTGGYKVEEPDENMDYQYFIDNPQLILSLPAEEQREIRERLAAYFEIERSLQEIKKSKNEIDAEEAKLVKEDFEGRLEQQRRIEELRQSVAYQERERLAELRRKELENMEKFIAIRKSLEEQKVQSSSMVVSHVGASSAYKDEREEERRAVQSRPREDYTADAKDDSCDFGFMSRAHDLFTFLYNLLPSTASSNPRITEGISSGSINVSSVSRHSGVDRIFGGNPSENAGKKKAGAKKGGVAKIFGDEDDDV